MRAKSAGIAVMNRSLTLGHIQGGVKPLFDIEGASPQLPVYYQCEYYRRVTPSARVGSVSDRHANSGTLADSILDRPGMLSPSATLWDSTP